MRRSRMTAAACVMAAFLGAGCRGEPDPIELEAGQPVTGSVSYRTRIALPPDAEVVVTLEDVTRADARSTVVATQTIPTRGRQVPIPFELAYPRALFDPSHRYAVRAQIRRGGDVLFTSTTFHPVLTHGAPAHVDVVVGSPVTSAGAGTGGERTAELLETYWRIVSLDGEQVTAGEGLEEPHLILKSEHGALIGSTGVNRLAGSCELPDGLDGAAIMLRPGAMTLIAGPEPLMRQEQQLLQRLRQVDGFRLEGEQLTLSVQGRDVIVLRAVAPR